MNVLSFDVGGTTIKGGLVNEKLKIKEKFIADTPKKESSFLSLIEKIHDRFSNETDQVSLGMPGFVDNDNHIFKYGTNMQFSIDFKKLKLIKDKKIYLENDGNLAAYSEYLLHFRNDYKNLIMLTFGTGIGGGIIHNSQIFKGGGNAGEIGRILINENSYLEDIISAKAWTNKCKELFEQNQNTQLSKIFSEEKVGSLLFDKSIDLEDNEKLARDEIIVKTSLALVSLFELFDNEIFVIGGSMTKNPYNFIPFIDKYIKKNFDFPNRSFPIIKLSKAREDSGLFGAALLALNSE
uniref:Transcriptional regulator/sugar kinase n=1 Tax=Candidatus Actinomarina minuta TaxID=1389454 RepID=S5DRU1_9ACTN|nr:transcriptional regulator/sugar kinase [Candidatus Actinomarina minuta]